MTSMALTMLIAISALPLISVSTCAAEDNISGTYSSLVDPTAGGMIGQGVFGENGAKLGEISDLVIRKVDKVSYAVISIADRKRKEIVVPYQALRVGLEPSDIVLNLTQDDISKMQEYEPHDFTSIRMPNKG
jgi:PRC-barrel domain